MAGAPRLRSKAREAKKNGPRPEGRGPGCPSRLLVGGWGLGVRSSGFVRGSGAAYRYSDTTDSLGAQVGEGGGTRLDVGTGATESDGHGLGLSG